MQLPLFDDGPPPTFFATISRSLTSRTLHGVMPADCAYLVSAASWASDCGLRPVALPDHAQLRAADAGGYSVVTYGTGFYPFSDEQYVAWLRHLRPQWAATTDIPWFPGPEGYRPRWVVTGRRMQTTRVWTDPGLLGAQAQSAGNIGRFASQYRDVPWAWVPTIQGHTVADYCRHARFLADCIRVLADHYARVGNPHFRVGVGSIKGRHPSQVNAIVAAVVDELPDGIGLHLWGAGVRQLRWGVHPRVVSFDTAVWQGRFGRGIEEQKRSGLSQGEYSYRIALPRYHSAVAAASSSSAKWT